MSVVVNRCRSALFWLVLLSLTAFAGDRPGAGVVIGDVDADYRDGIYFAHLACHVAASPTVALEVLTDFDHMVGVVPNLERSRVVSRSGRFVIVEQRGKADFGPFSFRFESQRRVEQLPDGRLVAEGLSGSTKYMRSEIRVQAEGNGARLDYRVEMIPDRWLPSSLGVGFLRHELAEQFTALLREMERRQAVLPAP